MRDVLKLGEQLRTRMIEEVEVMLVERTTMRDVTQTRGRELMAKREEELRRIDYWAESQKAIVSDVFTAMIAENDADRQKHEAAIRRLTSETVPLTDESTAKPPTMLRSVS